jgi:hypothetical protein
MKWSVRQIVQRSLIGLAFLGIIVFVTWRLQLAKAVSRQIAAIHAAGLPASGIEADKYYAPVLDEENAALKMANAFDLMATYDDHRSNEVAAIKFPQRKETLLPEHLDLIAGYCAMNSSSLAQAREAIKLSRSRYEMDLSWGAYTLLPHLSKLKALARIAVFESLLNTNEFVSEVSAVAGMARTLDAEPVLISKLVRIAMLNMAVADLENRLNHLSLSDEELSRLMVVFADSVKTNQMADGLIGERAMMIPYFRMSWAEIRRLADSSEENFANHSGPPLPGSQPIFLKMTGFFERDLRFYLQAMETNIFLAKKFPINVASITNAANQTWRNGEHKYYILSMMLLPALESGIFREATGLAEIHMAQTALAVERFRLVKQGLPENLNQLIPEFLPAVPKDPCDGQPLRFRRLENGYLIYSVGKDGQDNGGRERPANAKSSDKAPYDLTFTVER